MFRLELDPKIEDPRLNELWRQIAKVSRQMQSPPVCRVIKSGTQSLTSGNVATLAFPTTSSSGAAWDSHAYWDTSNNRYLPTDFSGYWRFTAKARFLTFSAAPSRCIVNVRRNGSSYSSVEDYIQNTAHTLTLCVSDQVYLNGSTDYVDVQVLSESANATVDDDSFYTSLSIEYVGADQVR